MSNILTRLSILFFALFIYTWLANSAVSQELYILPDSVILLYSPSDSGNSEIGQLGNCQYLNYTDNPFYFWKLPDNAFGDSVYTMRFDANSLDTVKLVEFFVYDRGNGLFGNDDIYVCIRDDNGGVPGAVLHTDTLEAGTYPSFPQWTTVYLNVQVQGDFHVTLATSAPPGDEELILSDDGNHPLNITRSYGTGSIYWTLGSKWYSMLELLGVNLNFLIKALVCGNQYTDCSIDFCFDSYSDTWALPNANDGAIYAQKFERRGDSCKVVNVTLSLTWPLEEDTLPLYSDSARLIVFDDNSGFPGPELYSTILTSSFMGGYFPIPGIGRKDLFFDLFAENIQPGGEYWIGIQSFAADSTTGIRVVSDQGGSGCEYWFAQFDGIWNYISADWPVPSDVAMSVTSENCCPHTSLIEVPTLFATISQAINYAQDNDTILVLPGTYYETITFDGKPILITSLYALTGDSSDIYSTILTGDGPTVSFVNDEDQNSIISGFTISGGDGPLGGGIYCGLSGPTIRNNRIVNNDGGARGGGIYCLYSNPIIEYNFFGGNNATYGGGIASFYSNPEINYNTFLGNSADFGGGIYYLESGGNIRYSIISNNNASNGGAIYFLNSVVRTDWMSVIRNSSQSTGVINLNNSSLHIFNGLIAFNNPNQTTFYCQGAAYGINVGCSNMFGNKGGDWILCGINQQPVGSNIQLDPQLCNWTIGDFYLNEHSPCTESNSTCGQIGALGVGCTYLCGDADGDSLLTISDINFIQQYYFECEQAPFYFSAGDSNCDGVINLADVLYLSEHLLSGGPAPCCP